MRVERYDLPLARPLSTARETIDRRSGFLVTVTDDGRTGVGEAAPLPPFTETLDQCEAALARAREAHLESGLDAAREALDPDRRPAACHGLACATLDARARAAGTPLYRRLGGAVCESIPVNGTVGDGSPSRTAEAAAEAVAGGFDTLKVKVGAREPATDAERLAAVRDAVGQPIDLRADANGAWSLTEARTFVAAVEDCDLEYVEQPLPADDLAGHAALREGPVPVALDESLASTDAEAITAADAADVVVLKPMSLGSPTATRGAAMTATEAGLGVVVTTTVDAVVARTAAVHVAASLPSVRACGLATADRLGADLGPDPAPVSGGSIAVPQAPGLGVEEVST